MMMIAAEILVHTDCGISMRAVLALRATVNTVINTPVDRIIVSGLRQLELDREPPRITGNTGNTQGARMLSSHAIRDKIARDMIEDR